MQTLIRSGEIGTSKNSASSTSTSQNHPHHSCKDVVVPARDRAVVPTGLAIAAPSGTYARIAPRSGLAVKKFIDTGAGVVDEDYRGEVGVVLFNHSGEDFHGENRNGDRGRFWRRSLLSPSLSLCLEASQPLRPLTEKKKHKTTRKNQTKKPIETVKAGDRVAQLILERIATPEILEVEDLDDTARGAGGYGSTGVKS